MPGRPSMCGSCGGCERCKRAAYMREWWRRQSPEKKRAYLDRRLEVRGDEIREADRKRQLTRATKIREYKKRRALWTVHNALRDGRLFRAPCEVCDAERVDAHHENYDEPLNVRWLCRKHHGEQHRKYVVEREAA